MLLSNYRGNVLVFTLIGMTMIAALGLGMFYMFSASISSGVGTSSQNRAYYLALAGKDYASIKWNDSPPPSGDYFLYNTDRSVNGKFFLGITGNQITSTGTVNEASKKIIAQYNPGLSGQPGTPPPPFSFAGEGAAGMAALATPAKGVSGNSGVTVDTVNRQINLGLGATGTAGCVWYQGWADSNGSDCTAGRCNFNKGIRAYFDFQYNTNWGADGFTFAIISAHNNGTVASPLYINNVTDCGGGSCGEYMAYAGPGLTGNGLQPPKIAVEFDPHIAGADTVCSPFCNSRKDISFISPVKHAAFSYWGTDNTSECSPQSNTYDDNRHGRGDANNPKNPENGDTNPDGTYPFMIRDFDSFGYPISSPAGRMLSFRLEIDRVDNPISPDYRKYKLRAWLKAYAVAGYQDSNGVKLDDTSKKFNQNGDYPPSFQQTITLNQTWHDKFDRIIFGWTQATGGLTQTVTIRKFEINFKNSNDF
ncbi:MAG: hypothetical protein WC560_00370 [Syntrophales bacterium]